MNFSSVRKGGTLSISVLRENLCTTKKRPHGKCFLRKCNNNDSHKKLTKNNASGSTKTLSVVWDCLWLNERTCNFIFFHRPRASCGRLLDCIKLRAPKTNKITMNLSKISLFILQHILHCLKGLWIYKILRKKNFLRILVYRQTLR